MSPASPLRILLTITIGVAALLGAMPRTHAHEIRPALLQIEEREPGLFDVIWKVPVKNNVTPDIQVVFPLFMKQIGRTATQMLPGTKLERSTYSSNGKTIIGEELVIDQLSAMQIDVLVRLKLADGSTHSAILKPDAPSFIVPARASKLEVALSYWRMGVEHILGGIDHLLFVLALILIIPNYWNLLKAITAFTVAHSITLALATLGYVHMPAAPTEAVIALSILFLSVEIVRSHEGKMGLTERAPWIIAFLFGLFHGLGFAGALSDVGLPPHAIPLALLMFNIGVECGQILFVLFVVAVVAAMRQLQIVWPAGSWRVFPYAIGSLAAFWTFQRVGSFW